MAVPYKTVIKLLSLETTAFVLVLAIHVQQMFKNKTMLKTF